MAQKVFGNRCQGSHHERRDCVDRYMRYKPRPRQREPFGQTNHKRCARRPYVPVDKFERTHDHPADVRTLYLHQHDPAYGKQQSNNRPRTQDQNPSRPSHIWCGLQQWVRRPSGTDYSRTFEGDITEDRAVESAKFSRQTNFTGPPVQVCRENLALSTALSSVMSPSKV